MLIQGDARCLPLADQSVQCVVTSPPYFGLRDYGSVNQIGLELTLAAYVASLVQVFVEVWRVLRDDGTLWLVLGDCYAAPADRKYLAHVYRHLKPKDRVGIPWRVAFALQDAGWYLRSDIIWSKPNPLPESVTDRPTQAHEYVFLLTKSERYYYDAAAIAEPASKTGTPGHLRSGRGVGNGNGREPSGRINNPDDGRNKRTVWEIPTQPYAGAHFATFPEALVEPCILAGSRLGDLVLDPFIGSGTVGAVAERLSRRWVGIDLAYQGLAADRTAQRGLQFT